MNEWPNRLNLDTAAEAVRQFIFELARSREPVELISGGVVIARLTGLSALTDDEKQRIKDKGWELVQKARAETKGIPVSKFQQIVDEGVREVRARAAKRDP